MPVHTTGSLAIGFGKSVFVGDLFRGSVFFRGRTHHHYFKTEREDEREMVKRLMDAGYGTFY
jgi:hypothetical protein